MVNNYVMNKQDVFKGSKQIILREIKMSFMYVPIPLSSSNVDRGRVLVLYVVPSLSATVATLESGGCYWGPWIQNTSLIQVPFVTGTS